MNCMVGLFSWKLERLLGLVELVELVEVAERFPDKEYKLFDAAMIDEGK